jgi:hypothetical protein
MVDGDALQWKNFSDKSSKSSMLEPGGRGVMHSENTAYTKEKKQLKICLMFQEIHQGLSAKLSMRKGFLIYEESREYLQ